MARRLISSLRRMAKRFFASPRKTEPKRLQWRRMECEHLEQRELLAITGTASDDYITLQRVMTYAPNQAPQLSVNWVRYTKPAGAASNWVPIPDSNIAPSAATAAGLTPTAGAVSGSDVLGDPSAGTFSPLFLAGGGGNDTFAFDLTMQTIITYTVTEPAPTGGTRSTTVTNYSYQTFDNQVVQMLGHASSKYGVTQKLAIAAIDAFSSVYFDNDSLQMNFDFTRGMMEPPDAPTRVSATDIVTPGVTVTWDAMPRATIYDVYRNTDSSPNFSTRIGSTAATTFTDNSAALGRLYYYWVRARNVTGTSPFSDSDTGGRGVSQTVALPPSAVFATNNAANGQIRVYWNPVGGATGYEVWQNTSNNSATATLVGTTVASATYNYFDDLNDATPVVNGTPYYYWVKSVNLAGSSVFSTVANQAGNMSAIPGTPGTPAGVNATFDEFTNRVRVEWSYVANALQYNVWRNTTNSIAGATQLVTGVNGAWYDDGTAVAGTNYWYFVVATNATGTGLPSTGALGRRLAYNPWTDRNVRADFVGTKEPTTNLLTTQTPALMYYAPNVNLGILATQIDLLAPVVLYPLGGAANPGQQTAANQDFPYGGGVLALTTRQGTGFLSAAVVSQEGAIRDLYVPPAAQNFSRTFFSMQDPYVMTVNGQGAVFSAYAGVGSTTTPIKTKVAKIEALSTTNSINVSNMGSMSLADVDGVANVDAVDVGTAYYHSAGTAVSTRVGDISITSVPIPQPVPDTTPTPKPAITNSYQVTGKVHAGGGGNITLGNTTNSTGNDNFLTHARIYADGVNALGTYGNGIGTNGNITINAGNDLLVESSATLASAIDNSVTPPVWRTLPEIMTIGTGAITANAVAAVRLTDNAVLQSENGDITLAADAPLGNTGKIFQMSPTALVRAATINAATGAFVNLAQGRINISADGDATLSTVQTRSGLTDAVTVTSTSGGIVNGLASGSTAVNIESRPNNVGDPCGVILTSALGIGSDAALLITAGTLSARNANTAHARDVRIVDVNDAEVPSLDVLALDNLVWDDGNASTGIIDLAASGSITIDAAGTGVRCVDGNVTVSATDPIGNMLVNQIIRTSDLGQVKLQAGDSVIFTDAAVSSGSGGIAVLANTGRGAGLTGMTIAMNGSTAFNGGVGPILLQTSATSAGGAVTGGDISVGRLTTTNSSSAAVTINSGSAIVSLDLAAGTFNAPLIYNAGGTAPWNAVTGDLNADGKPDLVVTNRGSGRVAVFLSNGQGGLNSPVTYATGGANPAGVALGDIDGDGRLDIAVANYDANNVAVLLNTGGGRFGAAATYPTSGTAPFAVAIGDLDGDGRADLVVTNANSSNISVLRNNGAGGVNAAVTYASGGNFPASAVLGDLNGDGRLDVAVANYGSNNVGILLNGPGGLNAAVTLGTGGAQPTSVISGDFNGDLRLDLAVTNYGSDNVGVLVNNGAGVFGVAVAYATGGQGATAAMTADFNGDGWSDLAVTNWLSDSVGVLLNTGTGTFNAAIRSSAGGSNPNSIAVADFNADGSPDLAVVNVASDNVALLTSGGYNVDSTTGGLLASAWTGIGDTRPLLTHVQSLDVSNQGRVSAGALNKVDLLQTGAVGVLRLNNAFRDDALNVTGSIQLVTQPDGLAPATITLRSSGLGGAGVSAIDGDVTLTAGGAGADVIVQAPAITTASGQLLVSADDSVRIDVGGGLTASGTANVTVRANNSDLAGDSDNGIMMTAVGTETLQLVFDASVVSGSFTLTYAARDAGLGQTSLTTAPIIWSANTSLMRSRIQSALDGMFGPGNTSVLVDPASAAAQSYTITFVGSLLNANVEPLTIDSQTNKMVGGNVRLATLQNGAGNGLEVLTLTNPLLPVTGTQYSLTMAYGSVTAANPLVFYDRAIDTYATLGTTPSSVAVGDFNADGRPDLAVVNSGSNKVMVLLRNAAGGFDAALPYDTGGTNPTSVAVGDFNADGSLDLVVANSGSSTLGLLRNSGTGVFAAPVMYGSGGLAPAFVVVADFNIDGKPDVAVANAGSNRVGILLNDGSGGLGTASTYGTGGFSPRSLAVGNFNTDNRLDLFVGNYDSNTVGLLLNNGSGGFGTAATFATGGSQLTSIAVGDFNSDARLDVVAVNSASGTVSVLVNNLAGGFAAPVTYATGGSAPATVVVGDFNSDNRPDLAVTNSGSDTVSVLLKNGVTGSFADSIPYTSGGNSPIPYEASGSAPKALAIGDFNADGKPDLVLANSGSATVGVLQNNGAGYFGVTAATVKDHLESIVGLAGNVSVFGNVGGPFTVVFRNSLARQNVARLTATATVANVRQAVIPFSILRYHDGVPTLVAETAPFVNGGSGTVLFESLGDNAGDVRITNVQTQNTGDDAVTITTDRAVIDGSRTSTAITAPLGGLVIAAVDGVGSDWALKTQVDRLDVTNTNIFVQHSIQINETDGVTVKGLQNIVAGDSNGATGGITLTAGVPADEAAMTVTIDAAGNGVRTTDGDIVIRAQGINSNVVVAQQVVTDDRGSINIVADDSINIPASGVVRGSGTGRVAITASSRGFAGTSGGTLFIDGGAIVDGGYGTIALSTAATQGADATVSGVQTAFSGADETQLLSFLATNSTGILDNNPPSSYSTFTISYGNLTSTPIAYSNVLPTLRDNISAALDVMFGAGNTRVTLGSAVEATSTANPKPLLAVICSITFAGELASANLNQLTVQSSLNGGSIAVSTQQQGSGNAVQALSLSGTSGQVRLSFNGQTVSAGNELNYVPNTAPTAAAVQASLSSISALNSNVSVIGRSGGPFTILFRNGLAHTNVPLLTASTTGGAQAAITLGSEANTVAAVTVNSTGAVRKAVAGVDERQLLQFDNGISSGSFALNYGPNFTTGAISWDASDLQSALDGLFGLGNATATLLSTDATHTIYSIAFGGELNNVNLPQPTVVFPGQSIVSANGATEAGSVVTINTGAAHGFIVGDWVEISGVSVAGYNGKWRITDVPSPTSFKFTNTTTGLGAGGGGMAAITLVGGTVLPSTQQNGSNELQVLALGGATGTFSVGYNGQWSTSLLTYQSGVGPTAAALQAELETLADFNGNVRVLGNPGGPFSIIFENGLAHTNIMPLSVRSTAGVVGTVGLQGVSDIYAPGGLLVINAKLGVGELAPLGTSVASLSVLNGGSAIASDIEINQIGPVGLLSLQNYSPADGDGSTGAITIYVDGSINVVPNGTGVGNSDGNITLRAVGQNSDIVVQNQIVADRRGKILLVADDSLLLLGSSSIRASGSVGNEVQALVFDAAVTSGTFSLTYGDTLVSSPITWNPDPVTLTNNIQAALDPLFGAGNTLVARVGASRMYTITFQGNLADANLQQCTVDATLLTGGTVTALTSENGGGNTIQTVALGGSGSLVFSYIAPDGTITAATTTLTCTPGNEPTLQDFTDHLNSIPALNGNVTVIGAAGGSFTVVFHGKLRGTAVEALTADNQGTAAEATVTAVSDGITLRVNNADVAGNDGNTISMSAQVIVDAGAGPLVLQDVGANSGAIVLGNLSSGASIDIHGGKSVVSAAGMAAAAINAITPTLSIHAAEGIGTALVVLTADTRQLLAVATAGGVYLSNRGALTVGESGSTAGILAGAGDIDVSATGPLTVKGGVTGSNNITLGARDSTLHSVFGYGAPSLGWVPLMGDWNGDGVITAGLFDPKTSVFYLRNTNDTGYADIAFGYGVPNSNWIPMVGDWDGDGRDTIGFYDPSTSYFYLRNTNDTGVADYTFGFGAPGAGWEPIVGDWDGDKDATVGLFDRSNSVFYLSDALTTGYANYTFGYGVPGSVWKPVIGDWNGDHRDSVGFYDPASALFMLRNTLDAGVADQNVVFGPAGSNWTPFAGDFSGQGFATVGLYDPYTSLFHLTPGDDVTVYDGATVATTNGNVVLQGGDGVSVGLGALVKATGGVTLNIGYNTTDGFGMGNINGAIEAPLPVTINGGAGDDTLIINLSYAAQPLGGFNFVAGDGADALFISGTHDADTFLVDDNTGDLKWQGKQLGFYTLTESVTFNTLGGDDLVNFKTRSGLATQLRVEGGPDSGNLNLSRDAVKIVGTNGDDNLAVGDFGSSDRFWVHSIETLQIMGGAGNDTLTNDTAVPAVLNGGAGNDTLTAGHARGLLNPNDPLSVKLGDALFGGDGVDSLTGRDGVNYLFGDHDFLVRDAFNRPMAPNPALNDVLLTSIASKDTLVCVSLDQVNSGVNTGDTVVGPNGIALPPQAVFKLATTTNLNAALDDVLTRPWAKTLAGPSS